MTLPKPKSHRFATFLLLVALLPWSVTPDRAHAEDDGPVKERARELVQLINGGSPEAIETYVRTVMTGQMRDAFPLDVHVDALAGMHARGAPYEIVKMDQNGQSASVLLRSDTRDAWVTLTLRVADEPPYRVDGIGIQPTVAPPPEPAGEGYTDAEIRAAMEATIADLVAADRFSGAVALARGDEIVFQGAYGEASKDFAVANRIDTKFNLGSMNKMFTAVAIAQLVERGDLAFDKPLAAFLPEFPTPEAAAGIRVEHLLTHSSGLGNYFNQAFMDASRARFRTVSDFMTLVEDETLQFEPGTRRRYSNTGFLVLGRIIEVATGQDYHDYIREHVTGPAGMESTACYELDHVNRNLAVGYDRGEGPDSLWRNNLFRHVIRGGPAGGGYSTVGDLLRFARALRAGTLVSAETLARLTSPKPELASPTYGFGFALYDDGSVGHSGGFPGISAQLAFWPDGEWTIAVLSNLSGGAQPVTEQARRLIAAAK